MRVVLGAALCLMLALGRAAADEKSASEPRPLSPEQAADAVLIAVQKGDTATLAALARKEEPDPWLVVDQLCARSEHDAAHAYAAAAPGVAVAKLPAYVASRRGKQSAQAPRMALARMHDALERSQWNEALQASEGAAADPASVAWVRILSARGLALDALEKREAAIRALHESGAAAEAIGWLTRARAAHHARGLVLRAAGQHADSVAAFEAAARVAQRFGGTPHLAMARFHAGVSNALGGRHASAVACYRAALALPEDASGDLERGRVLLNLAAALIEIDREEEAPEHLVKALDASEREGDWAAVSACHRNLALLADRRGAAGEAKRHWERALALEEELGHTENAIMVALSLATVDVQLGAFAAAQSRLDRVVGDRLESLSKPLQAEVHSTYARLHYELGTYEDAIERARKVLDLETSLANPAGRASALAKLGQSHFMLRKFEEALSFHEAALAIREALGRTRGVATSIQNLAGVHEAMGNGAEARALYERAIEAHRAAREPRQVVSAMGGLGSHLRRNGKTAEALRLFDEALAVNAAIDDVEAAYRIGGERALALIELGRYADAIEQARRCADELPALVRGLADMDRVAAVGDRVAAIHAGLAASVHLGDGETAFRFMELARAAALRDLLARGGSHRAWNPSHLAAEQALARREREAWGRYRRAVDARDLALARGAREALEAARAEREQLSARGEREARARLPSPGWTVATAGEVRVALEKDGAFVSYTVHDDRLFACVLTRRDLRFHALGDVAPRVEAASRLRAALEDRGRASAAAAEITALRQLVVEPLALDETGGTLVVSPGGELGGVPFAALMEGRAICYVPSGTTLAMLAARPQGGTDVLGIAVPSPPIGAVPGAPLPRLGAAEREVREVADLVKIQHDATEPEVRKAVAARTRWRSIHFACHAVADLDDPLQSGLVLMPDDRTDGIFTALDMFDATLRADLVVLSACETARGRAVPGEGALSLVRPALLAGANRVLASLWRVDDEATRALMVRFYELWHPDEGAGLGAAAALEEAQAHVRNLAVGYEIVRAGWLPRIRPVRPWRHPHYWAAWVLWGLGG